MTRDTRNWSVRDRLIRSPAIMGIVNVTPDSFSDGGRYRNAADAVRHASSLIDEGADLLDIGGESSRPGAEPVTSEEEARRVVPVIEALSERAAVPLSVDTTKAQVALRALKAGAHVINDISGLTQDPEMPRVVADTGAGVVLMHMAGTPRTMQDDPRYEDVVRDVYDDLARKVEHAEAHGIARERIAIDPGIGFGKTFAHNIELVRHLGRFRGLGCMLMIGTSRKRFLGAITGREVHERLAASVVAALATWLHGADVLRVHDVGPTRDALRVWAELHSQESNA